jgi:hypothetical protein
MQPIIRIARVRFLRRAPHSSVSMLTAVDVGQEPHPELQEQYASLLDTVWKQEAIARRDGQQVRHRCEVPGEPHTNTGRDFQCSTCGQRWHWSFDTDHFLPAAAE